MACMRFLAAGAVALQLLGGCFQSRAEDDAGDVETCGMETVLAFGPTGGETSYDQTYELSPVRTFVATRVTRGVPETRTTCTTQVPECDTEDVLVTDIGDIASLLRRPDVEAAFAEGAPPLYGLDDRPVDGTVFAVTRFDGRSFMVGGDCGSVPSCVPIPPVIALLVRHLQNLVAQELAQPPCAALR
jgi:hypothetical protein